MTLGDPVNQQQSVAGLPSRRFYLTSVSVIASSLVAAATGVFFWAVAARLLTPERLGVQTALLAVITGPSLVIAAGVGDALNATVPARPDAARFLLGIGYRWALRFAVPVGVVSAICAVTLLPAVRGSLLVAVAVFLATLVWTLFAVQDSALTSLGKASWLPVENGLAGIAKLVILPFVTASIISVVTASAVPAAVAVVVLVPVVRRVSMRPVAVPVGQPVEPLHLLRGQFRRFVVRTTGLVALTVGALTVLPFVVTSVGGARQGAVFSLALSMTSVLDFVTAGIGVSLVVHASANPEHEWALIRKALAPTVPLVTLGAVLLIAISHEFFRLLNAKYLPLHAVQIVVVLATSSVLRTVFLTWTALQQSRQQLTFALWMSGIGAALAYIGVALLVPHHGAVAAAWIVLATQVFLTSGAVVHMFYSRRAVVDVSGAQP